MQLGTREQLESMSLDVKTAMLEYIDALDYHLPSLAQQRDEEKHYKARVALMDNFSKVEELVYEMIGGAT